MSTQTKDDTTLRLERIIAASPERLFALWTEPEELIKWWGPEGFTTPKHAIDVRPGGRWRTTMRRPDGTDHTVSGIYRAIEPPRRILERPPIGRPRLYQDVQRRAAFDAGPAVQLARRRQASPQISRLGRQRDQRCRRPRRLRDRDRFQFQ